MCHELTRFFLKYVTQVILPLFVPTLIHFREGESVFTILCKAMSHFYFKPSREGKGSEFTDVMSSKLIYQQTHMSKFLYI